MKTTITTVTIYRQESEHIDDYEQRTIVFDSVERAKDFADFEAEQIRQDCKDAGRNATIERYGLHGYSAHIYDPENRLGFCAYISVEIPTINDPEGNPQIL